MKTLQLEVGKTYVRRDGSISLITELDLHADFPFCDSDGFSYTREGNYWVTMGQSENDLIRELDETPTSDPVNHPPHYTSHPAKCECGKSIECIQIAEHFNFNLGNALKYLWRSDLKNDTIEDLRKAVWYIQREIAKRQAK